MFYLDTCIWLNLFKKEGDPSKGVPYWKVTEDFIERFLGDKPIVYSNLVLREIEFRLGNAELFKEALSFMKKFKFVKIIDQDYSLARKLESEFGYELGFYDCLHIAVCKRMDFVLVTRDKTLSQAANKHVWSDKPENLFP